VLSVLCLHAGVHVTTFRILTWDSFSLLFLSLYLILLLVAPPSTATRTLTLARCHKHYLILIKQSFYINYIDSWYVLDSLARRMLADLTPTGPSVATFNLPPSLGKRGHEKDDKDSPRKQIRLSKLRAPIKIQRQCNWCQKCLKRLSSLPTDGSSVRCLYAGTRTRCEYCVTGNRRSSDCVMVCFCLAIDSHVSRSHL
jgi:hypothetical protein